MVSAFFAKFAQFVAKKPLPASVLRTNRLTCSPNPSRINTYTQPAFSAWRRWICTANPALGAARGALAAGRRDVGGGGYPPCPAQTAPQAAPLLQEAPASLYVGPTTPTCPYTPTLQFLAVAGGDVGGDILANQGYAPRGLWVQLSILDVNQPRPRRNG